MNNIIEKDDNLIGYYDELKKYLKDCLILYVEQDNMDEVRDIADDIDELNELSEYDGLIILSENNGMGFSARKYEGVFKIKA